MSKTPWYKVTDARGHSPYVGYKYTLPKGDKPGDWHRVEGDLIAHKNGFHLTGEPLIHRKGKARVFRVETEGATLKLGASELLARGVRLTEELPWSTFEPSGAMVFLQAAWSGCGGESSAKHSWQRLNSVMHDALSTAIVGLFAFDPEDFRRIVDKFNGPYWMSDAERYYSMAIDGRHGPNPSAIASIERWKKRKPFIVETDPLREPGKRSRLHVGATFTWFDGNVVDREHMLRVKVTLFDDEAGVVVACSYKRQTESGAWEPDPTATGHGSKTKIHRVLKLTHKHFEAHHAALKARRAEVAAQ